MAGKMSEAAWKRLDEARARMSISETALAKGLGVSNSNLYKWRRDGACPLMAALAAEMLLVRAEVARFNVRDGLIADLATPPVALEPEAETQRELGWHPDRNARIVAAFDAGETLGAIGESYGVTRERVRQIVQRAGREPRLPGIMVVAAVKRTARLSRVETAKSIHKRRNDSMAADLRAGMSIADVALKHDAHIHTAAAVAKAIGPLPRGTAPYRYTPEQRDEMKAAILAGEKARDISRRLNMSERTIRTAMHMLKVKGKLPDTYGGSPGRYEQIIGLRQKGLTYRQIERELHVSAPTIRRAVMEAAACSPS